ncbi:hypothetical protein O181_024816 [Austropuccinia psidii MF-1]|uniref:Uncharacterized protein n=1 Tax=Austropuccinia psidii MF-1 TaxID=1389203 RepID=A0A9Q3CHE6_9BASI|nr:hypothetical protein [Austropuccinia psidii MF-1]
MVILTTIAAAFFIRSLSQDRDLSGLIQTLYDIKPFDLNMVLNCVAVEHCQQGMPEDQALLLDKQNPNDQSKPPNHTGNRVAEHRKEPSEDVQQLDSDAYVLEYEVLSLGSGESDKIYLNTGAG